MSLERTRVFAIFPTMDHSENYTSCLGAPLFTNHKKAQQELLRRHFVRVAELQQIEKDNHARELQELMERYKDAPPNKLFSKLMRASREKKVESDLDISIYWTWAPGDDVFLPYGVIDLTSKGYTPATISLTGWVLLDEDEITVLRMEEALQGTTTRPEPELILDSMAAVSFKWRSDLEKDAPKRPRDHISQAMAGSRRLRDTRPAFTPQRQHRYARDRSGKG
jgi:hypothetical protein